MKISLIFILFLLLSKQSFSQEMDSLRFQQQQRKLTIKGMGVLGSWAVGNIAIGFAGASSQTGVAGYRSQMNGAFNLVNLGLALPAFLKASRPLALKPQSQALETNITTEKILLFNTGFDFAYIATGFYLQVRGKNQSANSTLLKGYGQSLVIQGAFLLLFDGTIYYLNTRNRRQYQQRLRLAKS